MADARPLVDTYSPYIGGRLRSRGLDNRELADLRQQRVIGESALNA
jgi:hypothetical protein